MPKKSHALFQNSDGLPMQFHLPNKCRSDTYRQQIVSMIQDNGGEIKSSARENVILLVDPEKGKLNFKC